MNIYRALTRYSAPCIVLPDNHRDQVYEVGYIDVADKESE